MGYGGGAGTFSSAGGGGGAGESYVVNEGSTNVSIVPSRKQGNGQVRVVTWLYEESKES